MSECCCIGFGKCSYFYFYLFGAILTNAVKRELLKVDSFVLTQFLLLQSIYRYISYILFGLIFNWILNRYLNKKKNNKDNNNEMSSSRQISKTKTLNALIYNNILKFPKKEYFFLYICLLCICITS